MSASFIAVCLEPGTQKVLNKCTDNEKNGSDRKGSTDVFLDWTHLLATTRGSWIWGNSLPPSRALTSPASLTPGRPQVPVQSAQRKPGEVYQVWKRLWRGRCPHPSLRAVNLERQRGVALYLKIHRKVRTESSARNAGKETNWGFLGLSCLGGCVVMGGRRAVTGLGL